MSRETRVTAPVEGAENAIADISEAEDAITTSAEKSAAEGAEGGTGVYVHKFRKPFEHEGKQYSTLTFHFERLTGRDVIAIENEMQANNEYALDPLLSRNFQSKMASRAGGVGCDVLEAMPIQDFNRITNAARNFLIDTGY